MTHFVGIMAWCLTGCVLAITGCSLEVTSSLDDPYREAPDPVFDAGEPSYLSSPEPSGLLTYPDGKVLEASLNQVLVSFSRVATLDQRDAVEGRLAELGHRVVGQLTSARTLQVEVSDSSDIFPLIDELKSAPGVLVASPNVLHELERQTSPPSETGDVPGDWWMSAVGIYRAWDYSVGSPDIRVGVIDTYIDPSSDHWEGKELSVLETDDLPNTLGNCSGYRGSSYYNNCDHGTSVSALAASRGDDGVLSAGGTWWSPLTFADCFQASGGGAFMSDILAAGELVLEGSEGVPGARLLNLSIGRNDSSCSINDTDCRALVAQSFREDVTPLVQLAAERNALVFFSAGNTGFKEDNQLLDDLYDSRNELWRNYAVIVAATDASNRTAGFSREGVVIDVAAPGVSVSEAHRDGTVDSGSGTSYSAPMTMGVGALVWDALGRDDAPRVKGILLETAFPPTAEVNAGSGIIDAGDAVAQAYSESSGATYVIGASEIASAFVFGDRQGDQAARIFTLGDLDQDGLADFMVTAPDAPADGSEQGRGEAYLFMGREDWNGTISVMSADAIITGDNVGDRFGSRATPLGDVDGDTLPDFAILAEGGTSGGVIRAGGVYVFLGRDQDRWLGSNTARRAASVRITNQRGMNLAEATLLGTLDWNGDGLYDVAIGVPRSSFRENEDGAVFLLRGRQDWKGDIELTAAALVLVGDGEGARAGAGLAIAGDVDGDGVQDVLIGSPGYGTHSPQAGRAYLVMGRNLADRIGTVLLPDLSISFDGDARYDAFGTVVASVGDLDDDGLSDFAIGAPMADGYGYDAGAVYFYLGSSLELWGEGTPSWESDASLYGEASNDLLGSAIMGMYESAEGYRGVAIGAPGHRSEDGAVYLVQDLLDQSCIHGVTIDSLAYEFRGDVAGGRYGSSLDTFPVGNTLTFMVGAPRAQLSNALWTGVVYMYQGPVSDLVALYEDSVGGCSLLGGKNRGSRSLSWAAFVLLGAALARCRKRSTPTGSRREHSSSCPTETETDGRRDGFHVHRRAGSGLACGLLLASTITSAWLGSGCHLAQDEPLAVPTGPVEEIDGAVVDRAGEPIPGAEIMIDGELAALTGPDGRFVIDATGLLDATVVLEVRAEQHAPNLLEVPIDGIGPTRSVLLVSPPFDYVGQVDGALESIVDHGRIHIELPAGLEFEDTSEPTTGLVDVKLVTYFPGDGLLPVASLMAEPELDDDPVDGYLLQTLGMVGVFLESQGRQVVLPEGSVARLEISGAERYLNSMSGEIPYQGTTPYAAGDTAPLYHLGDGAVRWTLEDEEGWWVEETEDDDEYDLVFVTYVSHFSYWNIDVRVPATCLTGSVFTRSGSDTVVHGGVLVSTRGYTRQGGEWHTWSNTEGDGQYCQRVGADTPSFEIWFDKTFDEVNYKEVRYGETPAVPREYTCGGGSCTVLDHEIPCGWFQEHGVDVYSCSE